MKNISILLLTCVLLLLSPLLFGDVIGPQSQLNGGSYQQQSLTENAWYNENVKLVKHIKELQTQLIAANNHIIKLYQYLEKKTVS